MPSLNKTLTEHPKNAGTPSSAGFMGTFARPILRKARSLLARFYIRPDADVRRAPEVLYPDELDPNLFVRNKRSRAIIRFTKASYETSKNASGMIL